ncbi:MAG TPA: hypothetical protein VMA55_09000 [Acidovorax sp.]|jgi:hypothetical protein|nr:hypothetical protein [Acidovorax sp.]
MTTRWVTLERATELTGLPVTFFHERTGKAGVWPEGQVWKWFEGRKLIDMQALDSFIDQRPSVPSQRGRRPRAEDACPA